MYLSEAVRALKPFARFRGAEGRNVIITFALGQRPRRCPGLSTTLYRVSPALHSSQPQRCTL